MRWTAPMMMRRQIRKAMAASIRPELNPSGNMRMQTRMPITTRLRVKTVACRTFILQREVVYGLRIRSL